MRDRSRKWKILGGGSQISDVYERRAEPSRARPRDLASGRDLHPKHMGRPLNWSGARVGFQERGPERRIFLLLPTPADPGVCSQSMY